MYDIITFTYLYIQILRLNNLKECIVVIRLLSLNIIRIIE